MFLRMTFACLTRLTKFAVIVTSASSCLMADEAKVASVVSGPAPLVLGDASLTAGLPGQGPVSSQELDIWLANPGNHVTLDFSLPKGLEAAKSNVFIPEGNSITRAKIELGRQLYFDARLSYDSSVSCASCHDPAQGYGAATRFGVGIKSQEGGRNSPVSYNRLFSREQFWDGRAATLEAQGNRTLNPVKTGDKLL